MVDDFLLDDEIAEWRRQVEPTSSWRDGVERVLLASAGAELVNSYDLEEIRAETLRSMRVVGVESSEPLLSVAGSTSAMMILTRRRVIVSHFQDLDVPNRVHHLFCEPAELQICLGGLGGAWHNRVGVQDPNAPFDRAAVQIFCTTPHDGGLYVNGWLPELARPLFLEDITWDLPEIQSVRYAPHHLRELMDAIRFARMMTVRRTSTARAGEWQPRLIRSAADAEEAAADFLRHHGFPDARVTAPGADGGIDVASSTMIAQVKAEMVPSGRPLVQQIYGAAQIEGAAACFFSLAGFTNEALAWAERASVALFRFDLQGVPEPANSHARALVAAPDE